MHWSNASSIAFAGWSALKCALSCLIGIGVWLIDLRGDLDLDLSDFAAVAEEDAASDAFSLSIALFKASNCCQVGLGGAAFGEVVDLMVSLRSSVAAACGRLEKYVLLFSFDPGGGFVGGCGVFSKTLYLVLDGSSRSLSSRRCLGSFRG